MNNVITNDKEAFEYVKTMLIKQGEQSKDLTDNCQYRGYSHNLIEKLKDKAEGIFLENRISDDLVSYLEWECEILDDLIINESPDLKCAAGWLIDDSFYNQNFEGEMVHHSNSIWMAIKKSNPVWFANNNSLKLVTELQNIHDARREDEWAEKFDELEQHFNAYGDYIPQVESKE